MKPKIKKKKPNKKAYYVNPKEFLQYLKDYYESDDLIDELAESVSFELKYLGLDINEIPTLKHLTKTK